MALFCILLLILPYTVFSAVNIASHFNSDTGIANPYFYFNGRQFREKTLDCSCSVTNDDKKMNLYVYYINFNSQSCNNVHISIGGKNLFNCSDNRIQMIYESRKDFGKTFNINIRHLQPVGDEAIFFRIWSLSSNFWGHYVHDSLDVNCSGLKEIEAPSHSPKATTTEESTIKPTRASTSSINTSVEITNTIQGLRGATTLSSDNAYIMFGGILAAIVVINITAIGVYCFIRHRSKQKKEKPYFNELDNMTHNNRAYTYIDGPDETNSSPVSINNGGGRYSNSATPQITNDLNNTGPPLSNVYHALEPEVGSDYTAGQTLPIQGSEQGEDESDNYNHIGEEKNTNTVKSDTYNHIGGTPSSRGITLVESNDYDHIKSADAKIRDPKILESYGDYNHIPSVEVDRSKTNENNFKKNIKDSRQKNSQDAKVVDDKSTEYMNVGYEI